MKRLFTLLLAGTTLFSVQAQQSERNTKISTNKTVKRDKFLKAAVNDKKILTGLEDMPEVTVPPSSFLRAATNVNLGETNYDLQSNGTMKSRIVNQGNGKISAAWTIGTGSLGNGVADRGTGYNTTTNGKFASPVTARIEKRRTGFTNLVVGSDGTEYVFAHGAGKNGTSIWMQRKKTGETAWTEKELPNNNTNGGVLWASAAVGGKNGKTIHLVALTDVGTSAAPKFYKGIQGNLLYYRSKDGGDTWDIQDQTLPTIDSTTTYGLGGDSYTVKAKDDVIAIGLFDDWGDSKIFKSTDNGTNWEAFTMLDFPLTRYKTDQGYTFDDLGEYNPNAPDSLAVLSTDNAGCIFIDGADQIHALAGRMWYADTDLTDGNSSYYPGTNGMLYWRESEPSDLYLLDLYYDANQDTTINIDDYGKYYKSLTAWPTMVEDPATGDWYISYAGIAEGFTNEASGTTKTPRHVFVARSTDTGATWKIKDLIDDTDLVDDSTVFPESVECTFPQTAELVDGNLHVMFQGDDFPDLHVQFPSTEPSVNYQMYVKVPLAKFTKTRNLPLLDESTVKVFPNPASDNINLSLNLTKDITSATLVVTDIMGKVLTTKDLNVNDSNINISVANYPMGTYLFTVKTDKAFITKRVVKQ